MLPVEGRTVLDVVPPPTVSFVETLVTVRSELDPFLHAEALTYTPSGGGYGIGGGGDTGNGGVTSGGGGGGVVGGDMPTERSGGSGFLTFGLSSSSCALVGLAFLAIGLLLLVQPVFAVRKWWRDTAGSDDGSAGGRRRGIGALGRSGERGGHWRYGQVETEW